MVDTNNFIEQLLKSAEETNRKTIEEANKNQSIDIKGYINQEIQELKQKFEDELNKKISEWENKYTQLKENYDKIEKELRKNNIVVFGLENPSQDLGSSVVNILNNHLGTNLTLKDINNVYSFGKQTTRKPIIVKFVSYLTKKEVLRNSRKLKGTGISVVEELSLEEIKENRILRQHLNKARSNKLNAYIKNKKLTINGQEYTAQQLAEEAEDTETENTSMTSSNKLEQTSQPKSGPSTPNTTRKELQKEQEHTRKEESLKLEKTATTKKTGPGRASITSQKLLRSSARANSGKF